MVELERDHDQWMSSEQSSSVVINGIEFSEQSSSVRIDERGAFSMSESMLTERLRHSRSQAQTSNLSSDGNTNFAANALSAAGAAFLSAVIVNPLDVAKTRLQAQAAGAPYAHPLSNATSRMAFFGPNMSFMSAALSVNAFSTLPKPKSLPGHGF